MRVAGIAKARCPIRPRPLNFPAVFRIELRRGALGSVPASETNSPVSVANCQEAGRHEIWILCQSRNEHEEKMFAVIKTGGKQYSVAAEDVITVMSMSGEPGDKIVFDDVLMLVDEAGTKVGAPFVEGVSVAAEIVEQARGPKVYAFKKRRRQNSKRKRGHRQDLTLVKITEVRTGVA
jgi:large subunit ribosomal protein L21